MFYALEKKRKKKKWKFAVCVEALLNANSHTHTEPSRKHSVGKIVPLISGISHRSKGSIKKLCFSALFVTDHMFPAPKDKRTPGRIGLHNMVRASKEVQDIIANALLAFVWRLPARLGLVGRSCMQEVMRNGVNLPKYPQMDSHQQMKHMRGLISRVHLHASDSRLSTHCVLLAL